MISTREVKHNNKYFAYQKSSGKGNSVGLVGRGEGAVKKREWYEGVRVSEYRRILQSLQ